MPTKNKQPRQRNIQRGGIYTTLSASECHAQEITTNLKGKAWRHPVLVLGRHSVFRNCLRIMTMTPSPLDYKNTIPFEPLRKDKRHPMQLRLAHHCFLPEPLYLRIDKEYYIDARGLNDELGRVPKNSCQGLGMLTNLLEKRSMEREKEEARKNWNLNLEQEGLDFQPRLVEQTVLDLEHPFSELGLDG